MELLDFTGGPWLLRNGGIVQSISYSSSRNSWISDNWIKDDLEWDSFGNFVGNSSRDLDIIENLNNWKYNRKGNTE